jgi:hypothetical protein
MSRYTKSATTGSPILSKEYEEALVGEVEEITSEENQELNEKQTNLLQYESKGQL